MPTSESAASHRLLARRDDAHHRARDPGMLVHRRPHRPADLLDLLTPALRVGHRWFERPGHLVDQDAIELGLALDVRVQRRGTGAELLGDPPHAQCLVTVLRHDRERRLDDPLERDRLLARLVGRVEPAAPQLFARPRGSSSPWRTMYLTRTVFGSKTVFVLGTPFVERTPFDAGAPMTTQDLAPPREPRPR